MENKIIFSASIARALLKKGHKIVDIKPDRANKDRSIFVFEVDETFINDFLAISKR